MAEQKVTHLGVIMDGNRRWARAHKLESVMRGHEKGVDTFMNICEWCREEHIPYLTVYAFSTENWNRSEAEVTSLFRLMGKFFTDEIDTCIDRGIRIRVVGDLSRLDAESMETVRKAEEMTAGCRTLYVQIAISYGGRDEIVRAARKLAAKAAEGKLAPEEITEDMFGDALDTAGVPDMDLVIRTGGNRRLSNFFPWQTTYAELVFTDTLWPDFTKEELCRALAYYETIQINKGK